MVFKEKIADYVENHAKPASIFCVQDAELLVVRVR
jgi:hypothetical protein